MPLNWQQVSIPFLGGLDSKTAAPLVQPGKLTAAENVVFTNRGQVKKRHGSDRLARDIADGTTFDAAIGLLVRDDELLLADGERLLSYSEAGSNWDERGDYVPCTISHSPVAATASNQVAPCYAEASGIGVWAWEDSRGGVRFTVVDTETGSIRYNDQSLATDGHAPRCIAIDGFIHILYVDDSEGALKTKIIKPAGLADSIAASPSQIITDIRKTNPINYDVVPYGDAAYFAYTTSAATTVKVYKLAKSGLASGSVTVTVTATSLALGITAAEQYPLLLLVCGTATGVSTTYSFLSGGLSFGALESVVIADVVRVAVSNCHQAVALDREEGGQDEDEHPFTVWIERDPGADANRIVLTYGFSGYLTFTGPLHSTIRHAAIASGGFRHGRYGYVVLTIPLSVQPTYFLYRHDGVLCGRFLAGSAGALPQSTRGATVLSPPKAVDDGYVWAGVQRKSLETEPTTSATGVVTGLNISRSSYQIARVLLDMDSPVSGHEIGRSLYLTGGMLWQYDGAQVSECGFAHGPEGVVSTPSTGSGSLTSTAGTVYAVRWYYEWPNAQGERERSLAFSGVVTMAAGNNTITHAVPTLTHTRKGTSVSLVGYRTEPNPAFDAVFYRFTDPDTSTSGAAANGYVANSVTADTVSLEDRYSDATLVTKEMDYQSGGELAHVCPEPPAVISHTSDRLFLASPNAIDTVTYSMLHFDGEGLHFTDEVDPIIVDRAGGPVTAIVALDDSVIVFKRDRIFQVQGDGPSNTGIGSYSPAREITADVGCIDQRSVCRSPIGVVFQSEKGIYVIGQDWQVRYIGADVEAYNGQTITSATLVNDSNQIRFLTGEGSTLLFDYFFGQWATWTNYEGVGAVLWKGQTYCYAKSNGRVHVESAGYTEAGAPIRMAVETGWLKPEAAQGYQSLRKFGVLGEYKSSHRVRVTVYRNYKVTPDYTFEWDPSTVVNTTTLGSEVLLGDDAVLGGVGSSVYQFFARPRDQKAQAFKIRFEDVPTAPFGESYVLTHLQLEVGVMPGLFRTEPNRSANSGG